MALPIVSAGRSIVTVEGLGPDTSYIFTAYSGSGCRNTQTNILLASATSVDPSVNPGTNRPPKFTADAVPVDPVVATEDKGNTGKPRITASAHSCPPVVSRIFKRPDRGRRGFPVFPKLFTCPVKAVIDLEVGDTLTYEANVLDASGKSSDLPGWLKFDGDTRTFTGTPGRDDARQTHTIQVKVTDAGNLSDTTTFRLQVETPYNSRLSQVAKQWLARFGRTVSSQVTEAVTGRLGDDGTGRRITVNSQTVSLAAGEAAGEADDTSNPRTGLNGADPFATAAPTTKEEVDEELVKATATTRDLLLSSSFRLPLNPAGRQANASASSATTSAGDWTVWGEAALTNFAGEDGDLSIDGEVITGVAAIDWQRDRWLAGLALSQSQGDGTFEAPRTDTDDAINGTVKSSLTAVHPYVRYRPSADLEFWGVAGYGRGTMTLDADGKTADDEATANPDIWLTTIGIGGRSALLTTEQTGGPAVDLTADALFTRTGADADIPLRDAVEAATTRVRLGVESSWPWQNANGTSLMPTLSTALRYDAGDAETGLDLEVGAGVAYANPGLGLTLSADVRGLLTTSGGR